MATSPLKPRCDVTKTDFKLISKTELRVLYLLNAHGPQVSLRLLVTYMNLSSYPDRTEAIEKLCAMSLIERGTAPNNTTATGKASRATTFSLTSFGEAYVQLLLKENALKRPEDEKRGRPRIAING